MLDRTDPVSSRGFSLIEATTLLERYFFHLTKHDQDMIAARLLPLVVRSPAFRSYVDDYNKEQPAPTGGQP